MYNTSKNRNIHPSIHAVDDLARSFLGCKNIIASNIATNGIAIRHHTTGWYLDGVVNIIILLFLLACVDELVMTDRASLDGIDAWEYCRWYGWCFRYSDADVDEWNDADDIFMTAFGSI
jgi:hypothetical protein